MHSIEPINRNTYCKKEDHLIILTSEANSIFRSHAMENDHRVMDTEVIKIMELFGEMVLDN